MYHYVYETKIITPNRFAVYYGKHSTDNLDDGYQGSGKVVCNVLNKIKEMKKNGKSTVEYHVTTVILKMFDTEKEAYDYEIKLIDKVKSDKYCVNINLGGRGIRKGSKLSKETKERMKISKRKYYNSDEFRKKVEEARLKRKPEIDARNKHKMECQNQMKSLTDDNEFMKWHLKMIEDFIQNDKASLSPLLIKRYLSKRNKSKVLSEKTRANNIATGHFKGENNPVYGKLPWETPCSLSKPSSQLLWSYSDEIYDVWVETKFRHGVLKKECLKRKINIPESSSLQRMIQWFEKGNDPRNFKLPERKNT